MDPDIFYKTYSHRDGFDYILSDILEKKIEAGGSRDQVYIPLDEIPGLPPIKWTAVMIQALTSYCRNLSVQPAPLHSGYEKCLKCNGCERTQLVLKFETTNRYDYCTCVEFIQPSDENIQSEVTKLLVDIRKNKHKIIHYMYRIKDHDSYSD
jgi:hypothetical protein